MILGDFQDPVETIKGVGPVTRLLYLRLGIQTVSDLLRHFPRDYQDRRHPDNLSEGSDKERIHALIRVESRAWIGKGRRKVLKVRVTDDSAAAELVCFNRNYLYHLLNPGSRFWISGVFRKRYGTLSSSTFELEPYGEESRRFGCILPIYPLTEGLTQEAVRRGVREALKRILPRLQGELPEEIRRRLGLLGKAEALAAIHFPPDETRLKLARKTLAFEELFLHQLALVRAGRARRRIRSPRPPLAFNLKSRLLESLPFRLIPEQEAVLAEIEHDLFSSQPMSRLLQGEVGCGKTLVALLAALEVIEAGDQAALLAPTEILARQHARQARLWLEPLGVRVALLVGGMEAEERRRRQGEAGAGSVDLLVGTHALFSPAVEYRRLGLVVVDEQQRFGVQQRQALLSKGQDPDLLLLSATPIPRTLALALYGDIELSEIHGLPPGRRPVATHLTRQGNEAKVYARVLEELKQGRQAFFIYPLIQESEDLQLKDAERMFEILRKEFFPGCRLGLVHSRVPDEQKAGVMEAFRSGEIQVLVATSVLEVGVDVPNATCMVIEGAERFGLSALHQMRGRIGRGPNPSAAYLIYSRNLTEEGIGRLKAIMSCRDGFRIAEEDLRLRGPGELLGLKQSGFLRLGWNEIAAGWDGCRLAHLEAQRVIDQDPGLSDPEYRGLEKALVRYGMETCAGLTA